MTMLSGRIRRMGARGFGFIKPACGGDDVFVHVKDVGLWDQIRVGQRVKFNLVEDSRGQRRAQNVILDAAE